MLNLLFKKTDNSYFDHTLNILSFIFPTPPVNLKLERHSN